MNTNIIIVLETKLFKCKEDASQTRVLTVQKLVSGE